MYTKTFFIKTRFIILQRKTFHYHITGKRGGKLTWFYVPSKRHKHNQQSKCFFTARKLEDKKNKYWRRKMEVLVDARVLYTIHMSSSDKL
jgi:hypothetical protein